MARITVERGGGIATVTFTNPPRGYMDRVMVGELNQVVPVLAADPEIRAIVFTGGVNGVFIQHYDVAELHALATGLRERGLKFDPARPSPDTEVNKLFRMLGEMDKPAIAAINGNAMGGGFELCLACDIRIAERGPYSLGLPEINIGILPGAGGTQRLARLIGEARALEMLLRGRTVNPDEALALGLVHEAVDGKVMHRALHIAHELAGKSPLAIKHIKRLVRQAAQTPIEDGLAVERTLFLDLLVSDAAQTLLEQFLTGARDIRTR